MGQAPTTDLLAVLAVHPSVTCDQRVFCRLLASSKAAEAVVAARCTGEAVVRFAAHDLQRLHNFCSWCAQKAHNFDYTGHHYAEVLYFKRFSQTRDAVKCASLTPAHIFTCAQVGAACWAAGVAADRPQSHR